MASSSAPARAGSQMRTRSTLENWCSRIRPRTYAPEDPAYNRLVTRPYPARHETLWRDDALYDLVLVIGSTNDPVENTQYRTAPTPWPSIRARIG